MKPGGTGLGVAEACGQHRACCRARAASGSEFALIDLIDAVRRDGGGEGGDERSGGRCLQVRLR